MSAQNRREASRGISNSPSLIMRVSPEVLQLILEEVSRNHSSASLLSPTLVCRTWHAQAQRLLESQLEFDLGPGRSLHKVDRLLTALRARKRFRESVRRVTLRAGEVDDLGRLDQGRLALVADVVSSMTGLVKFVWISPAPVKRVFGSLQQLEKCTFDIQLVALEPYQMRGSSGEPYPQSSISTQEAIDALQPLAMKLSQLQLVVDASDPGDLLRLGILLAAAQYLQSLSIYLAGRNHFRGSWRMSSVYTRAALSPWLACALRMSGQSTLSKLSTLELVNVCVCEEGESSWHRLIQWPHLQTVTLSCPAFVSRFTPQLARIRNLSLQLDARFPNVDPCCPTERWMPVLKQSLLNFTTLETFEIRNATCMIDYELISHMGKTLRTLSIRSDQDPNTDIPTPSRPKECLSLDALVTLGSACTWLQELTVDAPGEEEELWPFVDAIADNLGHVRDINLNFDATCTRCNHWTGDFTHGSTECDSALRITYDLCMRLWERIHDRAATRINTTLDKPRSATSHLNRLKVLVGSPVRADAYAHVQNIYREQRTYTAERETSPNTSREAGCRVICHEVEKYRLYPHLDAYSSIRRLADTAKTGIVAHLPYQILANRGYFPPPGSGV